MPKTGVRGSTAQGRASEKWANAAGALAELASLPDMRAVIRKSDDVGRFEPRESVARQEGVERFGKFRSRISS